VRELLFDKISKSKIKGISDKYESLKIEIEKNFTEIQSIKEVLKKEGAAKNLSIVFNNIVFNKPKPNLTNDNFILYIPDNGETYEELIDTDSDFFNSCTERSNIAFFNYRGVGESKGQVKTIHDLVADADAMYQYLVKQLKIPKDKIVIHGRGVGGIIAAKLAEQNGAAAVHLERTGASPSAFLAGRVESWVRNDLITNPDGTIRKKKTEKPKEGEDPYQLSAWRRKLARWIAGKVEDFTTHALSQIGWNIDAASSINRAIEKNKTKVYYSEADLDEVVRNSAKISKRVLELHPRYQEVDHQMQKEFDQVQRMLDSYSSLWTSVENTKTLAEFLKQSIDISFTFDHEVEKRINVCRDKFKTIDFNPLLIAIKNRSFDQPALFKRVLKQLNGYENSLKSLLIYMKSRKDENVDLKKLIKDPRNLLVKVGKLKNLCNLAYVDPNKPLYKKLYLNSKIREEHEKSVFVCKSEDISHKGKHLINDWAEKYFA
jgi:dienelactone hydrolase